MKKFLKIFLILAVLVILLIVAGALVVTNSSFQKSMFLSAMEGKVEKVEVDKLSAGFSHAQIKSLNLVKDGAVVKVGDLDVDYSLWALLFSDEIRIDQLTATGLYVDTTKMKPGEKKKTTRTDDDADEPFEFEGVFENAETPMKIYIGKINVQGEVKMPNRQLTFTGEGGDIAPGKEGKLIFTGQLNDQSPGAKAEKLAINGQLIVNQTTEQKLDRIEFIGDVQASGGSLSQPAKLNAAILAEKGTAKGKTIETYTLTLSANGKELLNSKSEFRPAAEMLKGGFKANVARADVAPFIMGADLPDFTLTADETFTLNGETEQFDIEGTLELDLRNLGQWKQELADVGSGKLVANLKSTIKPEHVLVEKLDANFDTTSGRKLLSLQLQREFKIELDGDKPKLDGEPGELLTINLTNLPVAWLNPFLGAHDLSGGDISGAMTVAATSQTNYEIKSTQPWQASNLNVVSNGKPVLNNVTLALQPDIKITGGETDVQLANLSATSSNKQLINGSLTVKYIKSSGAMDLQLDLSGDLAKLQAQPVMEPYAGLAGGQYALTADVNMLGAKKDFTASLDLKDLTTKKDFVNVPSSKLTLQGDIEKDGATHKVKATGDLTINGVARATDAKLTADLALDETKAFDMALNGDTLIVDQLQFLQRAFKNPDYTKPGQPKPKKQKEGPDGPDKSPAWSGFDGTFDLDFKEAVMGKSNFKNLNGKLVINEKQLSITPLSAELNGAPVSAKAVIDFRAGNPKPYLLDANLDLEGLQVATLTSETGREKDAGVTGLYSFKGKAGGASPTLGEFSTYATFDLDLKGVDGELRTEGSAVGTAASGIGGGLSLISEITSAAGVNAVKDNPAVQQINGLLKAINQQIEYKEISLVAKRDEKLNIQLNDFLLYSPQNNIKFKGQGKIIYKEGVSIKEQPMDISCRLWTTGEQLQLLNKIKLTGQQKDDDGYQAGPTFNITGSLSDPDYYSSLSRTLVTNAANFAAGLAGGALNSALDIATGGNKNNQSNGEDGQEQNSGGGPIRNFIDAMEQRKQDKQQQQQPQQEQQAPQQQNEQDAPESGSN